MRSLKFFFACAACAVAFLCAHRALAQDNVPPTVVLTDAQTRYDVNAFVELLPDESGALTFQDILLPTYANQFVRNNGTVPRLGVNGGVLWLRVRLRNESSRDDWQLGIYDPRVPNLDFYQTAPDGSGYLTKHTGSYLPFATREIKDPGFAFRAALPPGTEQSYYFRVASPSIADMPVEIWTTEARAANTLANTLAYGLFYGAMLIMAGYNFFLFFSLRERVYLYLSLVILGFAVTKAAHDGMGHQYLWSQFSNQWTIEYSIPITMLTAALFTSTFLELKTRAPKLNFVFNGWYIAIVAVIVLVPFINSLPITVALLGIELALIIVAIAQGVYVRYRPARRFMASWILPLVATSIYILYQFGILPFSWFANNLILVALAALALLWSLVLADRIQNMRAETQAVNRSLARSERQYRSLFQDSHDAVFIISSKGALTELNPAGLELLGYTSAELGALPARELFVSPDEFTRLAQTLDAGGFVADYEMQLKRKTGEMLAVIVSGTRWRDDERGISGYQGILRDVTERRRTQQELATYRLHLEELVAARTAQARAELVERRRAEAALEQRVRELSTLNDISKTISTVTDLQPALTLVAESIARLFDVASTAVVEIDVPTKTTRLLASYPPAPSAVSIFEKSFEWAQAPILQRLCESAQPFVIPHPPTDERLGNLRKLARYFHVTEMLLVPLRSSGTVNGVLVMSSLRAESFVNAQVISFAETIGGAIATAIENTRLYQQAQVTAVADERQRLARELHDSVTQLLYSIVLLAGGWSLEAEQANGAEKKVAQSFNELAELGQQALGEMRLLLYQLRAPVLTELGLRGALEQRLRAVEHRVGIQTQMQIDNVVETLPPRVQEELYLIAQEALNNALRHARASRVQIQLAQENHHLELEVQDNGSGFDTARASEGMGLRNMQTRAQALGANLTIDSKQSVGTRVQLVLPLDGRHTD